MSRIIDVVNKIMQISGKMNTLQDLVSFHGGFTGKKCFIFEIYNWKFMGKQKDAVDK